MKIQVGATSSATTRQPTFVVIGFSTGDICLIRFASTASIMGTPTGTQNGYGPASGTCRNNIKSQIKP
jgi:hypothetical protein